MKTQLFNCESKARECSVVEYTCNILAIINSTMDSAKSATSNDSLDDKLGGVNLPFLSASCGPSFNLFFLLLLVLLHSPCSTQMPLKLLIQAFQIYLIRSHIPPTLTLLHLSLSLTSSLQNTKNSPHPTMDFESSSHLESSKDANFCSKFWF